MATHRDTETDTENEVEVIERQTEQPPKGMTFYNSSNHLALSMNQQELREAIGDNLEGEQLNISDLTNIRVPAGGGTRWAYEDITGEHMETEIRGVIIHTNLQRAYWKTPFDQRKAEDPVQPDCYSPDAEVGIGDPGGDCSLCPLAAFGSADKGPGQACKQTRRVFLLPEDKLLPMSIIIPPASLKPMKQYLAALSSSGRRYTSVETVFKLTQETSTGGIKYSRIKVTVGGALTREKSQAIREYADMIRPMLDRQNTIEVVAAQTATAEAGV